MKIRSFSHALDLIARTMLPWELTKNGRVRLDTAHQDAFWPTDYCPLCGVAQCAVPTEPVLSGLDPGYAFTKVGITIEPVLMQRIMGAADSSSAPADRALLLAACGLA